jgi:hypothetical protein
MNENGSVPKVWLMGLTLLRGMSKISERFTISIGVGIFLAVCFYLPEENSTQSLADSCRASIGFVVWVPLGVLLAIIISFGIWTTFCIRCPQCRGLIRSRASSDRRTLLYPCRKCEILWDSDIPQRETSSSGN